MPVNWHPMYYVLPNLAYSVSTSTNDSQGQGLADIFTPLPDTAP